MPACLNAPHELPQGPQRNPIKWRSVNRLCVMLPNPAAVHAHAGSHVGAPLGPGGAAPCDVLYYEELDMPLEQLEQLKTIRVSSCLPLDA